MKWGFDKWAATESIPISLHVIEPLLWRTRNTMDQDYHVSDQDYHDLEHGSPGDDWNFA